MASKKGAGKRVGGQSVTETQLVKEMWDRYEYMRDYSHEDYLMLNDRCGQFWYGNQWEEEVVAKLRAQRRPHLTMNMILSTTDTMLGE